jgi:hypothetical protein
MLLREEDSLLYTSWEPTSTRHQESHSQQMVLMVLSVGEETRSKTCAFRSSRKEHIVSMIIKFAFCESCFERRSTA